MKRSLNIIRGYEAVTLDGKKGEVEDILFDQEKLVVRYLKLDMGNIFSHHPILIPSIMVEKIKWGTEQVFIKIDSIGFSNLPKVEDKLPISRKYEEELLKELNLEEYWHQSHGSYMPQAYAPVIYPERPIKTPKIEFDENNLDTKLRSLGEVLGYSIHSLDGKFGEVEDIIVEDKDWQILYMVIDTNNWVPWSKKVLISIEWMDEISYLKGSVKVSLSNQTIKESPEFDPLEPVNEAYEKVLYDYYGRPEKNIL